MKRIYYIAILFLIFIGCGSLSAQEAVPIRDAIKQSVIVDSRIMRQQQGLTTIQIEAIKGIISPAGEGDAIKFIQTLPGVSTGAEGTSSYYVRGGNSGNNAVTLDGVPIYGISHLMGMTSTIPAEIVSS
ncbi:MAG TPA: Plug domain-containing protein, partial [Bacteroidales bacterium]|nr:Plug domain-containing protein [Bacteroidales bacterium]